MSKIKPTSSKKIIPASKFDKCLISGLTRKDILKKFKGRKNGPYFLDKFEKHLREYETTLKDYCKKYLKISWPRCPISGEEVGYEIRGKGVILHNFVAPVTKEHSQKFKKACERFSEERKGENNPMYGKEPWNKNIPDDHPWKVSFLKRITGKKTSEETKEKQREARKKHPLKARHTTPHSEETKEKCRKATVNGWANGRFNRKTSIEYKVEFFLEEMKDFLKEGWVFQHPVKYFTLDFAFPKSKIGIECQGTFFHTDPRIYPNGPICAIQKRNAGRDKSKKQYLTKRGWTVIELWEAEINDNQFKKQLLCSLQELNLLKKSAEELLSILK